MAVDSLAVNQRSGFRVDPVASSSKVAVLPKTDGSFEVVAEKTKGAQRPSELNHGNIVFESTNGGIRCRFIEQTTVISLGALRKLRFPVDGKTGVERDDAGRTVLAALALCAGVLASERGVSLRSRCNLQPTAPRNWELIAEPGGKPRSYTISGDGALALLRDAVEAAEKLGLLWRKDRLTLKPTKELVELIRLSQEKMAAEGESEGA